MESQTPPSACGGETGGERVSFVDSDIDVLIKNLELVRIDGVVADACCDVW
jgi:hypothetical protein